MSALDQTAEGGGLDIEPGAAAVEEAAGRSLLDRVKARREERVANEQLEMDIPTWDGELIGVYKVVERSELEKMVRNIRARQNGKDAAAGSSEADVDFLIRACVSVVALDKETEEREVITPGFNKQLAELLGLDATRARDVVFYLFKNNGIAIAAHAMKLARWMQDTSKPVEDPT